jgi:hypothetical protein
MFGNLNKYDVICMLWGEKRGGGGSHERGLHTLLKMCSS